MLIYQTDDSDFAASAADALKEAGIDAFTTGGSLAGGSSLTVCVWIRDPKDYPKANSILIKMGATIDEPTRLLPKWMLLVLATAAVVLIILTVAYGK
jgi:hypothetical protein